MGCQKLDTDFCNVLEVIHSEKSDYDGKKCVNHYPFGLKHKGYNSVVNGTENKYQTYNGVEHNESLGFNVYEMELRLYDPAIGRWNALDPITHYSYSPYSAFDNNPVFWSDPSGADSEVSEDGNVITFTGQDAQDFFKILQQNANGNSNSEDKRSDSNDEVQRIPDQIDFVNVRTSEEIKKFKNSIFEWFSFVEKHADDYNIYPADIIDFWAEPKKVNEKNIGQKIWDFLDNLGGSDSEDTTNVILTKGNNKVRIGYNKNTKEHGSLYKAGSVDYQWDDKTNRGRISIRAVERGSGDPQAIIFMYFTGDNKNYYNEFKSKIENFKL